MDGQESVTKNSSAKSCFGYLAYYDWSFYNCCHCRDSLPEPVTLTCLHTCCRPCLLSGSTGEPTSSSSSFVKCPMCCEETVLSAAMPDRFIYNYNRLSILSSEMVCCNTCDKQDIAAEFWCADCRMSLCNSCILWHNKFKRRHRTTELKIARMKPLSHLLPTGQCVTHQRQIEVQCFTCREPKCLLCYESCRGGNHKMKPFLHSETSKHISTVIERIGNSKKQLSRVVSSLQAKYRDMVSRLQWECKAAGDRMLLQHKRRLCNAAVNEFDSSIAKVDDSRQRISCACAIVPQTQNQAAAAAVGHITMLAVFQVSSVQLQRSRCLLKTTVNLCTSSFRVLLRQLLKYWQENSGLSVGGGLVPLTSDIILRPCLGSTVWKGAVPPAPLLFDQASITFRTPVDCCDLAVTRDGYVLLAAGVHGLLAYSDRGQQLSGWRPPRLSNERDGRVNGVAVLSDGRAAVSVHLSQFVVLLRVSETGDTWMEDRRVSGLLSPPGYLAVHGDLLAAAVLRRNEQRHWVQGYCVQLVRLSSGKALYTQNRNYVVDKVVLTSMCVVTTNLNRLEHSDEGAVVEPFVIDSFSHSGEFLWRYKTNDEEAVTGLFSGEIWSIVYAAVVRNNGKSRVVAICGADGNSRGDVMSSSTHGIGIPDKLSLARVKQRTVLAMLSYDRVKLQNRTVTLYKATSQ